MNIYFTWSLWWYISLDSVLGSYSMISINYLSHCSAHRHLASLALSYILRNIPKPKYVNNSLSLTVSLSLRHSHSDCVSLWHSPSQCLSVSLTQTPTEDLPHCVSLPQTVTATFHTECIPRHTVDTYHYPLYFWSLVHSQYTALTTAPSDVHFSTSSR